MHFVFSNEAFLKKMEEIRAISHAESSELLHKLGVRKKEEIKVTVIAISQDSFAGFDVALTLAEDCEKAYQKTVDVNKLNVVVFTDLVLASKSPHLERASFILFADENLLSAKDYPELKDILPFLEGDDT
jgi:hypothetical protein